MLYNDASKFVLHYRTCCGGAGVARPGYQSDCLRLRRAWQQ